MAKRQNLIGQRFVRLTVVEQVKDYVSPKGYKYSQWLCECNCEEHNQTIVIGKNLTRQNGTKSCGCLRKDNIMSRCKLDNVYDLSGEYGIGYTLKGEEFWFDKEDYDKIKDYCWFINNKGYVYARSLENDGKHLLQHQIILNANGLKVDHKNHNTIDNRKSNLRIVTQSENMMNQKLRNDNTSGITGVTWDKRKNQWVARIAINYKRIHLGYFDTFEKAVKVRKEAEEKYFGEYSYDNSMKIGGN